MRPQKRQAGVADQVRHWICTWWEVGSYWEAVTELTPLSEAPSDVPVEAEGESQMHSAAQGRAIAGNTTP